MSSEAQQERAIAYLLGELSEIESIRFEEEMAADPELAKLVDGLEESMASSILAETESHEPSADFAERIILQLPDRKSNAPYRETGNKPSRTISIMAIAGWAAAACLMVLLYRSNSELGEIEKQADTLKSNQVVVSTRLQNIMTEFERIEAERDDLTETIATLQQQRSLDQMQIASLTSELDSLYEGVTVWDSARDEGIVRVYNLPELDRAQQDYQMWVITGASPDPISAGVFQVDQSGNAEYRFSPLTAIEEIKAFAISREQKGGATSPQGPIMLSGSP